MSQHEKIFLPFDQWAPDGVEFDTPYLEVAQNAIPLYGAHRMLEQADPISSEADADPITGGHSHLLSTEAPPYRLDPNADGTDNPASAVPNRFTQEGTPLSDPSDGGAENVAGYTADDNTFITMFSSQDTRGGWDLTPPNQTPVAPANPDVVLRWKARLHLGPEGSLNPYLRLWIKDTGSATEVIDDGGGNSFRDFTGLVDDEWTEFSHELTNTEIANITNWDQLEVSFEFFPEALGLQAPVTPSEDVLTDSWYAVDNNGDEVDVDLFTWLAYQIYVPGTYIGTRQVPRGGTRTYIGKLTTSGLRGFEFVDHVLTHYVRNAASKANVEVKYQLLSADTEGAESVVDYGDASYVIVKEWVRSNIQTPETDETASDTVSQTVAAETLNWKEDLFLAIVVNYGGTSGSSSTVTLLPDSTVSKSSGITGDHTDIQAAGGGAVVYPTSAGFKTATFGLDPGPAPIVEPGSQGVVTVRMKADTVDGVGQDVEVILKGINDAGDIVQIKNWTITTLSQTYQDFELIVGNTRLNRHHDAYDDLQIEVQFSLWPASLDFLSYEYPGDSADVRIYATGILGAQSCHCDLSWAPLEVPSPKNSHLGDRVEVYAGTRTAIYEVTDDTWVDLTNTGLGSGYADLSTLNDEPKCWDFASWGDWVFATNFTDELQLKRPTDSAFIDGVDTATFPTSETPKARFVDVVGAQLILADINPNSVTDATSYSIMCSPPLSPREFYLTDYNRQSIILSLIAKPGQITGLVGGEYGIVTKRNSLWRMSYVGQPSVFQFDLIAQEQGCPHPRSIVQVDQDIYFWGNGGIFVIRSGQQLERISGGRIEKLIFDENYEDYSAHVEYGLDSVLNESQVDGAYDPYTGLVWWIYRGKVIDLDADDRGFISAIDPIHRLSHFLVYNPREDRFSHGVITDLHAAMLLGRLNINQGDSSLHRGLLMFTYDNTSNFYKKFRLPSTYSSVLQSKIHTAASMGAEIGDDITLHAIRPMYVAQPGSVKPNFSFTIEAAQDPSMSVGLQTRTFDTTNAHRDGWIPLQTLIQGEFYRFTVTVPTLNSAQIKEFLGLQLRVSVAGQN